ncbi:efflux RND transporter periplasmic adaptor subunit [Falsiroseomonas tokyonensis]|uniref:Efflux RND transporter periplasmic adaptor subunit n=1 Tax=Falsiroseomonas tokyonensis TaxID=430521 RepID=A0ABV7C329_9PROT|nr:efflux RND transporter periplasmic adaptor subunit [Falsiroseomonas tokyonensis]MBU8541484.1 efflux RND transporter periplasmic adaptor subunit [Falsiroseomonas tokyonensis]
MTDPQPDHGRVRRGAALAGGVAILAAAGLGAWLLWPAAEQQAAPAPPPTPVVLATAQSTRLVREVPALGTILATSSVRLAAEITGRVTSLPFEEGAEVAEGELLVTLDPGPAEAEFRAAQAEAAELEQQLSRSSRLARGGFAPRGDVADLRQRLAGAEARAAAAESRLSQSRILAPFAGRLGLKEVSIGTLVQPGTPLVALDAVDPIDLRLAVPERDAARIAEGAAVQATSTAIPGRVFEGRVRIVVPRVDPVLRTVQVEARLPNEDRALRPGMLMQVRVAAEVVEQAVTVPPRAVVLQGPEHFVFRVADGIAQRTPVRIGQRLPQRMEIQEGLAAGDQVVLEGLQGLQDGARVQAAPADPATPAAEPEPVPGPVARR